MSQYDALNSPHNGDSALKDSHDMDARAIRTTNTGLPFGATSFVGEVNGTGDYTKITYYSDTNAEQTKIVYSADIAQSLNSAYFIVYAGRDKTKYYVWYSVDGNGTNPNLVGATGIQVDLAENDPAQVVALATRNAIIGASLPFTITLSGSIMTLTATSKGDTTDSSAETTGFNVTTMVQGTTELRAIIELTYDVNCNVIEYTQDIY